jgi:TATA-box binding protein (TBP) (component of TFIID and TFIIIB)
MNIYEYRYKKIDIFIIKQMHNENGILLKSKPVTHKVIIDETIKSIGNEKEINKLSDQLLQIIQFDLIPKKIKVSTMTLTCKIKNLLFDCDNIAKYIDLSLDGIVCVSKDDGHSIAEHKSGYIKRSLIDKAKKKKDNATKKKSFFNQVSMYVATQKSALNLGKDKFIHVKLFKNGSIQMAGCRNSKDIVETLLIVMEKMRTIKAVISYGKIVEKKFVSDVTLANISNISDFKISMINTNFDFGYSMNLSKVYTLLTEKGIECRFDRISHSCVNIKYDHPEKKISIFIFEGGPIIITGVKNGDQIATGYTFINKFLLENYTQIIKRNVPLL